MSYPVATLMAVRGNARKYTDLQLAQCLARRRNMRELLVSLGLVPRGGNYETIRSRIAALGLDGSHLRTFQQHRRIASISDERLVEAVAGSRSMAQVLRSLGLRPGGNQGRLKVRIERLGLDTSHFVGKAWRKGSTNPVTWARPIQEFLAVGRPVKSNVLKQRLIQEGLKRHACEACGRTTWAGQPIPLELDHVSGRRDDNRLENLRLLCPNCHAQTPTYRGRNIGVATAYSEDGPGAEIRKPEGP